MIRVLAFIRRRADVSRDAFRSHYEEIHVATALPTLGGIVRYERRHIREEIFGAPGFDCMTCFDYRDAAAVRAAFERIEGPQGDAIRRDELTFMDKPANVFFAVEEGSFWEATPAGAEPAQQLECARLLVCMRRPQGDAPASFRAGFLEDRLPGLHAAVADARWCRLEWARPGVAQGAPFDAVAELGAGGAGELAGWARALESGGARVIAVRVSLHETRMPG